jgi:hypothetical protein
MMAPRNRSTAQSAEGVLAVQLMPAIDGFLAAD